MPPGTTEDAPITESLDDYGRSELHYAAVDGDTTLVRELLRRGLRADLPDRSAWTPLHYAAQTGSAPVVRMLLQAGVSVDALDADGNTPLFTAVFHSRGDGKVIALLRASGANPYHVNSNGQTPLGLARLISNHDVAQHFADLPGDPEEPVG